MTRLLCITALLFLAGCQPYSLQELRNATPTGSEFQQALAKEYLQLAAAEEANYSWSNSWHFADKGLTAAYGNDVGPENISDWNVSEESRVALEEARDKLLTALKPEIVEAQPALAARAYRYFDCWVARSQDGWQQDRIDACKQGFAEALEELNATHAPMASADGVDTSSYIVFFEWNRAALSKSGLKVVAAVVDELSGQEGYEIILNGHTDTTGLERFNLTLSKKRAETVARALEKGGIDPDAIKIFAFGESDPRVPTADNVNEPQNRRVEIFIE
ncbi:MAG: OmpA family protein [Alphaproteobacteria bacterium]|nr:OmpA family protein [Alphaproteobacteria bacterium]